MTTPNLPPGAKPAPIAAESQPRARLPYDPATCPACGRAITLGPGPHGPVIPNHWRKDNEKMFCNRSLTIYTPPAPPAPKRPAVKPFIADRDFPAPPALTTADSWAITRWAAVNLDDEENPIMRAGALKNVERHAVAWGVKLVATLLRRCPEIEPGADLVEELEDRLAARKARP